MLIIGDISGIQTFLFDIRESGGKQAASLRFRSFRLQVMTECLARKYLWALGLPENHLIFCAAGKFAITGEENSHTTDIVWRMTNEVQSWLLHHTHGRLRFSISTGTAVASAVEEYSRTIAALQSSKLQVWSSVCTQQGMWPENSLVVNSPFDADIEAQRDVSCNQQLLKADSLLFSPADEYMGQGGGEDIAGVRFTWESHGKTEITEKQARINLTRLSRYIPRDANRQPIEFVELAGYSRGMPMLGVLKADVDSLGHVISQLLQGSDSLQPLRRLSDNLQNFFGPQLEQLMASNETWSRIYTIFSGGDDLLLVGPWDIMFDFAGVVHKRFSQAFSEEKLTLSAGLALIKPRYPIRLAAQQAEDLLEVAKKQSAFCAAAPKDQCAAMGDVWKWNHHEQIIQQGKQLADWVLQHGVVERGWLHTLMELTLLRRSETATRHEKRPPAMATARLAYHVSRNWPAADKPGEAGAARQWIDALVQQFDRYTHDENPVLHYLPGILRYALLATRQSTERNSI